MHKLIGRSKFAIAAVFAMAVLSVAGCGGSGESGKANPEIVGDWRLVRISTPASEGGVTITCPGAYGDISCTTDQEIFFENNGTYEAGIGATITANGVYNLNGNVLTVQYQNVASPTVTYTDTYDITLIQATAGTVNTLDATLKSSTSPANSPYIGSTYLYGEYAI